MRLYNQAQAVVNRTQASGSPHSRNNSYEAAGSGSRASPPITSMPQPVPHYPTADQEKAALRAYNAAKGAVDRNQGGGSSSTPIAYDALYPSQSQSPVSEKERLRREYEARDAAGASPPAPASHSPPAPAEYSSAYGANVSLSATSGYQIVSEKEALRRKYEAEERASRGGAPSPPPPRAGGSGARSPPLPPTSGPTQILSAIDEKARLRAKYDVEDVPVISGSSHGHTNGFVAPPPPPLMPRPPAEYIHETRAEDRLSRAASTSGHLDMQPFTPFANGFEGAIPPPPPLPRK